MQVTFFWAWIVTLAVFRSCLKTLSLCLMAVAGGVRILLPPITSLMADAEFEGLICMTRPCEAPQQLDQLESSGPYRVEDDLSIFRAIRSFYGESFNGTVPWSFWQTYRRLTGSNRSTSSLYHHWNGSIQRKYGTYLREKNLDECIKHIESEKSNAATVVSPGRFDEPAVSLPLVRSWSRGIDLPRVRAVPVAGLW